MSLKNELYIDLNMTELRNFLKNIKMTEHCC